MKTPPVPELVALALSLVVPETPLPDEGTCRAAFIALRFPAGLRCVVCGSSEVSVAGRGWRCRRCKRLSSVTNGTMMHGTKVQLRYWLAAIYHLTLTPKGIAALRFQRTYGFKSFGTVWRLLHRVRALIPPGSYSRFRLHTAAASSADAARVLGRRHREKNAASVLLRAGHHSLAVAVVRGADDAEELLERPVDRRVARTIIESLHTWIAGVFHGVSAKWFPRYVLEFVARWGDRQALLEGVLRAALARPPERRPAASV